MFHVTLPAGSQLAAARLYADRAAVIRRLLGASALAAFNELDDYHDVGPFLDRMVPTSLAAQQALAGLLEGYVAAATEAEWDDVDVDVEQTTGDAVRPEGMEHTWSVPFFKMWGALEAGAEFADALADARASIERTAQTDLSIAQAETMSRLAARVPAVERLPPGPRRRRVRLLRRGLRRDLRGRGPHAAPPRVPLLGGAHRRRRGPGRHPQRRRDRRSRLVPEDEEKDRQIADLRRELGRSASGPPKLKPR